MRRFFNLELRTALSTAGVLVLLLLAIGCLIWMANVSQIGGAFVGETGATRISSAVWLFGTVIGACLFGAMIYLWIKGAFRSEALSLLHPPITIAAGFLFVVLVIGCVAVVDNLVHDLEPAWNLTNEPELRLVSNLCLVGFFGALGWFLWLMLRAQGLTRWDVTIFYVGAVGIAALAVLIVFAIVGG